MPYDELSDVSDLSSVPSSRCCSPEPTKRYLTPSSQDSSQDDESTRQDCPPAKKRRRNPLPKERTTQYLSFAKSSSEQPDQVRLLVETLRHQKDIVVIAGAGISTSAGIPDFRSTDGLFKSLQKKHNLKASGKLLFDAAVYQDDALTAPFHELVRSLSIESAKTKPTKFHEMLARLGKENRLKRLYTQNIDGLETSMKPLETEIPLNVKGRWPVTIQLHGSIQKMVCQKCRFLCDLNPSMFCEADPPECEECSVKNEVRQTTGQRSHGIGRMRPRIVLYNEHNPDEEAITSVMNADVRSRPRVLVVAGTSLKIPGVRRLVKSLCTVIRSRKDGVTMFINNDPPHGKEFEDCFDLVVQGSTDDVADLVQLKHWEDSTPYDFLPEPVFGVKPGIEVVIPSTPKKDTRVETGLATPSSSHDEMSCEPPAKGAVAGKMRNPASKGRSIKDMLGAEAGSQASAPAKTSRAKAAVPAPAAKRPAAKSTATKKRGAKATPAKNASITNFSRVSKSGAVAPPAGKKGGKPMNPRSGNMMFPNLPKKAAALDSVNVEVVSAPSS